MLKIGRKAQTKLGRKQILPCEVENDLAEHCLVIQRKFWGLTMAGVVHLAYQLAARNGIKSQFCERKDWKKVVEIFPTSS